MPHRSLITTISLYLKGWIKRAEASGVNILKKFAKKLATWRSLYWHIYDTGGLSTGSLEGVNNKVKTSRSKNRNATVILQSIYHRQTKQPVCFEALYY